MRVAARTVVNLGSGGRDIALPPLFSGWREISVDVDPAAAPDVVASFTDLHAIPDGAADAVWMCHALEHLYRHEVVPALGEVRRILHPEGFVCIRVPDLQAVAALIADDRMDEVLYEAAAGPVSAHDVVFGFGPALAQGHVSMAHRTGFTPGALVASLGAVGFPSLFVTRRSAELELAAVARPGSWSDDGEPRRILAALGL